MAQAKYDQIVQVLRSQIEEGRYAFRDRLPSEHTLAAEFGCSRNTVRKALALLASRGYVQAVQGSGSQVIYQRRPTSTFLLGGIESLPEAAARNEVDLRTVMLSLEPTTVDQPLSERSGLKAGTPVLRVHRLRLLDGRPLILDTSWLLTSVVPVLTREVVETSIYSYLEDVLGVRVVSASRTVTVERATQEDRARLDLEDMGCVAVVSSATFDSSGLMFEYSCSRHAPAGFEFHGSALRLP
ncbi:UTRA domain-containing protein [Actinomyces sp. 2119]|uniref:UTRA domain-containing protein n=1 Tax=Actinomyces sp. 2119 TaxID=2321393 RepID=UPI000E6BC027|nr:UTRA domain-containing protein [Actinomyces sp. 2119]RJF43114.1 UTRA domain-containing protein [Actinomyces sp. 2119]